MCVFLILRDSLSKKKLVEESKAASDHVVARSGFSRYIHYKSISRVLRASAKIKTKKKKGGWGDVEREWSGRIDSTQNNNNNNNSNINHALGKREEKTVEKSGIPVSFFFLYFTLCICTLRKKRRAPSPRGGEKRRARGEGEKNKMAPPARCFGGERGGGPSLSPRQSFANTQ